MPIPTKHDPQPNYVNVADHDGQTPVVSCHPPKLTEHLSECRHTDSDLTTCAGQISATCELQCCLKPSTLGIDFPCSHKHRSCGGYLDDKFPLEVDLAETRFCIFPYLKTSRYQEKLALNGPQRRLSKTARGTALDPCCGNRIQSWVSAPRP